MAAIHETGATLLYIRARLHDGFLCLSAEVILLALLRLAALISLIGFCKSFFEATPGFDWPFRLIPIVVVGALWEAASLGA